MARAGAWARVGGRLPAPCEGRARLCTAAGIPRTASSPPLRSWRAASAGLTGAVKPAWMGCRMTCWQLCPVSWPASGTPIMAKMGARVQEPLAFKGGRYAEICKGRGDRRDCPSSRSIFLASVVGKQYHRILRGRLLPFLERYSPEVTCALKGLGVDSGSHCIRLALEWAAGTGQCGAVICFRYS